MNELIDYYNNYIEDERLFRDNAHKIEWLTTIKYLKKFIPSASSVFDCCAGTGRYSFWLAENGYEVTAGDLMQNHIDQMKSNEKSRLLKDIFSCNACEMSWIRDRSFDAVLCMGAYYHLHTQAERENTVSECVRILKNNGILVLAYINRNAVFINHFKNNPVKSITDDNVISDGKNGVFYASDFDEINKISEKFSLKKIVNIGVDGFVYPFINEINSLDEQQFKKYMDYHFKTCENPSILGNSMHGLFIAKK